MNPYYESHITFKVGKGDDGKEYEKVTGWKFSKIKGDPVLGAGVKAYLTHHDPANREMKDVINDLDSAVELLKAAIGIKVIRKKVELVVHDVVLRRTNDQESVVVCRHLRCRGLTRCLSGRLPEDV